MHVEPWDNPDLDDFEFLQGRTGNRRWWPDSNAAWFRAITDGEPTRAPEWRRRHRHSVPELSEPNAEVKRFRIRETFKGR